MLTVIPEENTVGKAADLLLAMANPTRLVILTLLTRKEMPVGVLAKAVGLSQSALSQHLAKLRRADLVTTRRDAQTVYYSCDSIAVTRLLSVVESLYSARGLGLSPAEDRKMVTNR